MCDLQISCDQFLPHNTMLAQCMLSSCVRPSLRLSQAGTVPKLLTVESCKQVCMIAPWT